MTQAVHRSVHLVGSVPLSSSSVVFDTVASTLGGLVKRIPDGETGVRKNWVQWQEHVVARNPAFEKEAEWNLHGLVMGIYRLKPGVAAETVEFGPLGYAAEAIKSYQAFKRLRGEGRIGQGVKFQVSLPTPVAGILCFFAKPLLAALHAGYQRQLLQELSEICAAIPHEDLAVQWDISIEVVFIMEDPQSELARFFPAERATRICAEITDQVPADVQVGWHFCYGDPGHKHVVEPKDTRVMVEFANDLLERSRRSVQWLHMPVPRARNDEAYFAPLKDLRLREGTELYLGLVHLTDGVAGAQRRVAAAERFLRDFGIAAECGFGRRPPETIPALLALHREAAAIGRS